MIKNLPEQFLYSKLPSGLVDLDELGIIEALVSGYQDRVEDLRSFGKKFTGLYATSGLPELDPTPNVVLVDLESSQGKTFTRSLDIQDDTPGDRTLGFASAALTTWAASQLSLSVDNVSNVRYGRDLLRLVDANTLDYLAASIGAILYKTNSQTGDATANKTKILESYFPRLKIKGTAGSFEVLGRILGFEDIRMTPQWGRLSAHLPNDPGSAANVGDFSAVPDYFPQQVIGPFYDPHKMDDGPFYTWSGTCDQGTASTQFYTQVINGFNPWIDIVVATAATYGTIAHPADGTYVLGSSGTDSVGGPHKKAYVVAQPPGLIFKAVAEGASFNGLTIAVTSNGVNPGTKVISITDRLSSIKYRSSYFDLGMTATMDAVEQIYGSSSVKKNKDLAVAPHTQANFGTVAQSPYRPWFAGSITTGASQQDFLVSVGTNPPQVVVPRVQASGTDRELNIASFLAAGAQVAQSLEEVRPATRLPLRTQTGFLVRDQGVFAAFECTGSLFTTSAAQFIYAGTASSPRFPLPAIPDIELIGPANQRLAAEQSPANPNIVYFSGIQVSGSYMLDTNKYYFNFSTVASGTVAYAHWLPSTTEVVRNEPVISVKFAGSVCYQGRPEDDTADLADEVADEYPWRRDIIVSGELEESDTYITTVADFGTRFVDDQMAVEDQTGAEHNLYGINSTTGRLRLTFAARPTDDTYLPGQVPIAFSGQMRDLASLSAADTALINTTTDLDTLLLPGYAIYHVGLVQGVAVADAVKFFGPAHRNALIGWLPFNEHIDDNLSLTDHSAVAAPTVLVNAAYTDRAWDGEHGWYLNLRSGVQVGATAARAVSDQCTVSFWIKPGAGSGAMTVFHYGPVSFDLNSAAVLTGYVRDASGARVAVASYGLASGFNFIYLRYNATEAVMGIGSLSASALETFNINPAGYAAFTDADQTVLLNGNNYGIRDLRLWSVKKTASEMEAIRYHNPTPTLANYRLGFIYTVNRQDRYSLRVLPNGFIAPEVLTAWLRTPALKRVMRYDSMGRYHGESRFREVGMGGGRYPFPAVYQLGQQYYNLTAQGQTVAAPPTGAVPGVNNAWNTSTSAAGTYLVENTGSTSSGTNAIATWSGTASPWPNLMMESNPARAGIWVKGDDGYVYELALKSVGVGTNAALSASRPVRSRTDAELILTGSLGSATLRFADQPSGAEVWLASSGTILGVKSDGSSVYIKPFSGTFTTPPLWMYLDDRIVADVANAYTTWTDAGDTSLLGEQQTPKVAARADSGLLEFSNTGTLMPGLYRLSLSSANIGKVDQDFIGFKVEIAINETILQKRLLAGKQGYNIQGTDEFEFPLADGVVGEWLLSINWLNAFADPSKGTARQLAILGYTLRKLQTELYKITIPGSGTLPQVDFVQTQVFYGTNAGGWLAQFNSYGTVASWLHESKIYSGNDTVQSALPLADVLTATTERRRSDIIAGGTQVVVADGTTTPLPSFGSLLDAAFGNPPLWMWSGGITTNPSVKITAKMSLDSPLLQAAVDTTPAFTNPVLSSYQSASSANNRIVQFSVPGLQANGTYFYAIANAGSIYKDIYGQFRTWSNQAQSFSFIAAADANNQLSAVLNSPIFDTIRQAQPLFFLHLGDLHYQDAPDPQSVGDYQAVYDAILQQSDKQRNLWLNVPVIYIYDDHDYAGNDSDGTWAFKNNLRQVYQQYVPTYPLGGGNGNVPTYFAFTVGRCRFIVTDLRSERSPDSATDDASKTMLGATQKAWFKQQLLAANGVYPIIFWANTVPWIGVATPGADEWTGFATERQELANFIRDHAIKGLFIVSGDMHALAADTGTNGKYADDGSTGIPVFQCAPLMQTSSNKGGPYTVGPTPGAGVPNTSQFAVITVTDDGVNTPFVRWSGRDAGGTELLSLTLWGTQSPV